MATPIGKPSSKSDSTVDRRANHALRALVNEILAQVRELSRRTAAWSPEERAQAEAELEMIMRRVRNEAAHPQNQK